MVGNFRIPGAQSAGDFKRRRLLIDCIDLDLRADPSRIIREQPRDIARTSGKIDNAHSIAGHYPAAHESRHETVATEPAIELSDSFKIALQLGRNRLRP